MSEPPRAPLVLPLAVFLGTFAWSFVYVSLPFYIQRVSTLDAAATLRWTGWILGISSIITVLTGPVWGRLAGRTNAKTLYVVVEALQGAGFFIMAQARTLPQLFLARALLGFMGAASTFAFIMAGHGSPAEVRRRVSAIQSAMTVGQVVGPLAGAVAAARVGFRESFLLGGLILWGCAALVWWKIPGAPAAAPAEGRAGRASLREVGVVCLLVLSGSTQIFFLPAILPQVLPALDVDPARTLEVGGLVIFASGAAAALGALAAPRLGELMGDRHVVVWFLGGSSVLVAALALAPEAWSFALLRFAQVLCVAPVFPLSVAAIAQRASGQAIGFVNSSRIGAAFLGPVVATTLMAATSPTVVYLALAAGGLAVLPVLLGGLGPRRDTGKPAP